jgi:hypothetical protein
VTRLTALFAAALLAGSASVSAAQSAIPGARPLVNVAPTGQQGDPRHAWLYASSGTDNVIAIYDLERFGTPKIGQITKGGTDPGGFSIDAEGALYVANYNGEPGGTVTIYPAGATSPSLTISDGLSEPIDTAVDTNGDLYVANRGSVPSIVVYPPGQITPSATITSNLIREPNALAFDANRDLYFSDDEAGISEIPYGSQQPVSLNLQGLSRPSGLALDPTNGNLIVSDVTHDQVFVYAPGDPKPIRTLRPKMGACTLGTGKIRGTEYILVPECNTSGRVWVFKHDAKNAFATLELNVSNGGVISATIKPAGVP